MNVKKMVMGFLLFVLGFVGLRKSGGVQHKPIRICVLVLSVMSMIVGVYLFYFGVTDVALMTIGSYEVGKLEQTITVKTVKSFEEELRANFLRNLDTRRLEFRCLDGSQAFTVYNTAFGIFGMPDSDVVCDNGHILLKIEHGLQET